MVSKADMTLLSQSLYSSEENINMNETITTVMRDGKEYLGRGDSQFKQDG